jgi:hypothetical protein
MIARKAITSFGVFAALVIPVWLMAAGDPFSGVWKLNLSKSTLPALVPRSQTVHIEANAGSIRIREEIVNDKGERTVVSVTAKFDGRGYPVTGSPFADAVAYQRVDRNTIKGSAKKGGKVVSHEAAVISKDGKTMTTTYAATDPSGEPITAIAVFEKQ